MVCMMNNAFDAITGALADLENAIDDTVLLSDAGNDALDAFKAEVEALAAKFHRDVVNHDARLAAAHDAAIEAAIDARRAGDR